jgi:hypothetical protein
MNNIELESALVGSVQRERECTALVLRYLREVERRRLYLERGYSSLYAYCTKKLGYSEPEAMLRIQAMRLVRAVPEAGRKIEEGKLSLSVASKIHSAVKEAPEKAKELVRELSGASKREAEKRLAEVFPEEVRPEKARHVNEDKVEIRFTVTREEYELFQKLMDRKAHSNFERKYEVLFTALAKAEMKKFEGKQGEDALPHGPGEVSNRPRGPICTRSEASAFGRGAGCAEVNSRYVKAPIKRVVWKRDEGRCQFVSKDGLKCKETHGLQLDHVQPFTLGGPSTIENLRLLCGAHNRHRNSS